jgi:hypothetical protein
LTVSENEELNTKAINEVLTGNSQIVQKQFLGIQSGIFKNNVTEKLPDATTIQTAFDSAIEYINGLNF